MNCPVGQVSHIDNCNNVWCAGACTPACTPNCTCAASICIGSGSCSDGCGGTCNGTKVCSGTINAKAVVVNPIDKSCNALAAAAQTLDGTVITFSGTAKPQTTGATLTWPAMSIGLYTISANPPPLYMQANICVSQNGNPYTQTTSGTLTDAGTLSFLAGYTSQAGWVQTMMGDVYSAGELISSIPASATNPYFSRAYVMGNAGLVSYGTTYDFSLSAGDLGETLVSPDKWLLKHTNAAVHFYEQFASRMDIPGSATTLTPPPSGLTKGNLTCATFPCMYYVSGDMATATGSPWNVGANEQIILFVNGNATINSKITITQGGFFALIANGNITVSNVVGGPAANATPVLEGIYIATNATHTAMFSTGDSGNAGTERLVIQGSVIADDFVLARDLGVSNSTIPAEQFIFNPQLLFTMPDAMKEIPYVWQEIAP